MPQGADAPLVACTVGADAEGVTVGMVVAVGSEVGDPAVS